MHAQLFISTYSESFLYVVSRDNVRTVSFLNAVLSYVIIIIFKTAIQIVSYSGELDLKEIATLFIPLMT